MVLLYVKQVTYYILQLQNREKYIVFHARKNREYVFRIKILFISRSETIPMLGRFDWTVVEWKKVIQYGLMTPK